MNYEFHVGDYFETKTRITGYITNYAKYFSNVANTEAILLEGTTTYGKEMAIDIVCNDLYRHFNRIGAYDFTKKEKKKIDRLDYNAYVDATIKQLNALKDKINELVDTVNELMNKEDDR